MKRITFKLKLNLKLIKLVFSFILMFYWKNRREETFGTPYTLNINIQMHSFVFCIAIKSHKYASLYFCRMITPSRGYPNRTPTNSRLDCLIMVKKEPW